MDSLLANYASSDEEEEQQKQQQSQSKPVSFSSASSTKAASSLFSSLPQPKSSPFFSSIPQPKQQQQHQTHRNPIPKILTPNDFDDHDEEEKESKKPTSNSNKPSSIFSSLPLPKSQPSSQQTLNPLEKTTKRVVQFKPPPPIQLSNFSDDDDEEEDDEEKERKKRKQAEFLKQSSSVKSFLSSIPAPKSSTTLGAGHSSLGSGRRSIIDTEAPASNSVVFGAENEAAAGQDAVNYVNYDVGSDQNVDGYANCDQSVENYANYEAGSDPSYVNYVSYQTRIDQNVHSGDASSYVNYGGYSSYGDYNGYGDHGQYGATTTMVQEPAVVAESVVRMQGKRGRKEIPTEIVEVKQDELMKNRPREEKAKLTGIAFGPTYQVRLLVFMCLFFFLIFST